MSATNLASPLKAKRKRSTQAELAHLDDRLVELANEHGPITVRGLYYRATVLGLVAKTEHGYEQVARRVLFLRRSGRIPYHLISDESMSIRGHIVYSGLGEFADDAAARYHKDYWQDSAIQLRFFLEKRALAAVITPIIIDKWGLELYVGGGQQSETLIYTAGRAIASSNKKAIFHVISDFDPGGERMFQAFATGTKDAPGGLSRFTDGVPVKVVRLAVTEVQVKTFNLPTREAKKGDQDYAKWVALHGDVSVELDAFRPDQLRGLIDRAIAKYMSEDDLDSLKEIEESERDAIRGALEKYGEEESR